MSLTVTDIFAGAGGSSTGMASIGAEVRIAANHDQIAVDVHQANHPDTEHAHVDLHQEDPRNFPKTDVLWASPECTQWSQANSTAPELGDLGDPTLFDDDETRSLVDHEALRSRLLMFDVLRFIEHHRYRAVIVENVVDVAMLTKYRRAWQAWKVGLSNLGYEFRVISFNAMHAQRGGDPAAQSRDRLAIGAWPKGEKAPDFEAALRPQAWCPSCSAVIEARQAWKNNKTVGRYRTQYVYVCGRCGTTVEPGWLPAASVIDWSILGNRIGDLNLKPKTRARIEAGMRRYWRPFLTEHTHEYRTRDLSRPLGTLRASGNHHGLLVPTEGRDGKRASSAAEPLRTQTTRAETGLLVPAGGTWNSEARSTGDPHRTFTTRDAYALAQPFLTVHRGGSCDALPITGPTGTMTASGNHYGLLAPYYSANERARTTDDAIGTMTTRDRYALITRHNGSRGDGSEMTTPMFEPLRTMTQTAQQSITEWSEDIDDVIDECLFRMLQPHEVAAAMAFPADYDWSASMLPGNGGKRTWVSLAGRAVCPPWARDLFTPVAESLGAA